MGYLGGKAPCIIFVCLHLRHLQFSSFFYGFYSNFLSYECNFYHYVHIWMLRKSPLLMPWLYLQATQPDGLCLGLPVMQPEHQSQDSAKLQSKYKFLKTFCKIDFQIRVHSGGFSRYARLYFSTQISEKTKTQGEKNSKLKVKTQQIGRNFR